MPMLKFLSGRMFREPNLHSHTEHLIHVKDIVKFKMKTTSTLVSLSEDVHPTWQWIFKDTLARTAMLTAEKELGDELTSDTTFPPTEEIFNAFKHCSFSELSVVILGQDPYPTRGDAHGLSFSVREGHRIPVSLNNIFNALVNDDDLEPKFEKGKNGSLIPWAKQGVLLLNASLTVKEKSANIHKDIWCSFTDRITKIISEKSKNKLVFVLWGGNAKKKKSLIHSKNIILEHSHPTARGSPGFGRSCKHFSQINHHLEKLGRIPINWQLPN